MRVLTQRQTDVMRLVARGMTNSEIARELCLSRRTVQEHLRDTFLAMGAQNRRQAIAAALREGVISLDWTNTNRRSFAYVAIQKKSAEDRVYDFMRAFLKRNFCIPPTIRQIAEGADVSSTSLVVRYLHGLSERGLLVRIDVVGGARTYTLPELAECAKGLE